MDDDVMKTVMITMQIDLLT